LTVAPDSGKDILGPVPLATVAQSTDRQKRVAVLGTPTLPMMPISLNSGNGDLLINTIDWRAGRKPDQFDA